MGRPDVPSDEDVDGAVQIFRRPNQLAWFEGHPGGNEGFSVSVSFNAATYTSASGHFIDVALHEASRSRSAPRHGVTSSLP